VLDATFFLNLRDEGERGINMAIPMSGRPRPLALLALICLAQSVLAADFAVTNAAGSGPGSLAQAISDANDNAGADRVVFQIPGAGVHKIDLTNDPLPPVTDELVIDGYTQPGAKANTQSRGSDAVILIQLDGGSDPTKQRDGLTIQAPNCVIRGLSITGFAENYSYNGFYATVVGGNGILVKGLNCTIEGNFVGLLPDGQTIRANSFGIAGGGSSTSSLVGGLLPASRNVISGNEKGIVPGPTMQVSGNYLGTDAQGEKAAANNVAIYGGGGFIGGTAPGAGNVISGNRAGVQLGEDGPIVPKYGSALTVKGNMFGVKPDGVTPLPNGAAILILYGNDNKIGGLEPGAGNIIAFNGLGIALTFADRNQILGNSIYANNGPGIDLGFDGHTPNQTVDNNNAVYYQNFPIISSTVVSNGIVQISGTLNSTPNRTFTIQLFSESRDLVRPVQTYLGSTTATTDSSGAAAFSASFPVTDPNVSYNVTATGAHNTSEFEFAPADMLNISTRGYVEDGENVLIGGFIIRSYEVPLLRGIGPSLTQAAVLNPITDPTVELRNSAGTRLAFNDDWKIEYGTGHSQEATIRATKLPPSNDLESAVLPPIGPSGGRSLDPGAYTAIVRRKSGPAGVGLVEAYHISSDNNFRRLENVSTRALVGGGEKVLIGGFILGEGETRVVVRALGPSLAAFGIANPLSDPMLELHDASGTLIAANDSWDETQKEELNAVRFAPSNDSEAAILTRLSAGAYSAIVRGKGNATGVGLVEIYNLH
jgi:hypothetical protein